MNEALLQRLELAHGTVPDTMTYSAIKSMVRKLLHFNKDNLMYNNILSLLEKGYNEQSIINFNKEIAVLAQVVRV